MAQSSIAIVIAAYRRSNCLQRLLRSVAAAQYPPGEITLVISLDGPIDEEVAAIARNFPWKHGVVRIIEHQKNLGLIGHMFACAGLATEYGAVILLEDDLLVSPAYFSYALQALNAYEGQTQVAGISLYSYQVSENGFQPFVPLDDGSDNYFMQVPSSWGVLFSNHHWSAFQQFLQSPSDPLLPMYVRQWPATSWKKIFFRYLIATNKYIVYPRISLSTNFGDLGTHVLPGGIYQVPLLEIDKEFRFTSPSESASLYDAWFELKPEVLNKLNPSLREYAYEVDLYGTKEPHGSSAEYFLTTRRGGYAVQSFGLEMVPPIANVLHNVPGNKIQLIRKDEIRRADETTTGIYGPYQWQRLAGVEGSLSLSVLMACTGTGTGVEDTLISINRQSSAVKEVILTSEEKIHVENRKLPIQYLQTGRKEQFFKAMQYASGDIYCWLAPGFRLEKDVIPDVLNVFRTFPQLQCLLGLSAEASGRYIRNVPQQRWTASMIARASKGMLAESFLPGCWFFRRDVFTKLLPELKDCTLTELIRKISEREKIFTLARVVAINHDHAGMANNNNNSSPRVGLLHSITRPVFLRDISFLRFFHYELNQFPDVIRKDDLHGTWYMSRY